MTVLMKNENGKVDLDDGTISFHMPTDRSALGMLAINKPINGTVFKKDGWVYSGDKRLKKWFGSVWSDGVNPVRIWEPKLRDVKTLELKYQKVNEMRDRFFERTYTPIRKRLAEVGEAYARRLDKDSGIEYWVHYTTREDIVYGTVVGEDHLYEQAIQHDENPDDPVIPVNVDIGEEYRAAETKLMRYGSYVFSFRSVLERAIEMYIDEHFKDVKKDNVLLNLSINERSYWYVTYKGSGGYIGWKKLAWQADDVIRREV